MRLLLLSALAISLVALVSCDDTPKTIGHYELLLERNFGADDRPRMTDMHSDGTILVKSSKRFEYEGPDDTSDLWSYDLNGKGEWELIMSSSEYSFGRSLYSPDKEHIAFDSNNNLYLMDADGENVRPLIANNWQRGHFWLDDTTIVYDNLVLNTECYFYTIDIETLDRQPYFDPQFGEVVDFNDACYTFSPNREMLVYTYGGQIMFGDDPYQQWFVVYDTETWKFKEIDTLNYGWNGRFSCDGSRVAFLNFTGVNASDTDYEIWVYDFRTDVFTLVFRGDFGLRLGGGGYVGPSAPYWNIGSTRILDDTSDNGVFRLYEFDI